MAIVFRRPGCFAQRDQRQDMCCSWSRMEVLVRSRHGQGTRQLGDGVATPVMMGCRTQVPWAPATVLLCVPTSARHTISGVADAGVTIGPFPRGETGVDAPNPESPCWLFAHRCGGTLSKWDALRSLKCRRICRIN